MEGYIVSKIKEKKQKKENQLLDSAYKLITEKGINNTSIQDIVTDAGVAKGTFYLYFNDKYDLQKKLIIKKSRELFTEAVEKLDKNSISHFDDQIIFIINHVIDVLKDNTTLLNFISKDLSLGIYAEGVTTIFENEKIGVQDLFMKGVKEHNIKLKNKEVTLFMIIELVSSTVFTSIIKKQPLSIDEYKPFLYDTIRKMINEK